MKIRTIIIAAALLSSCKRPDRNAISAAEADKLILNALSRDAEAAKSGKKVCVQKEFFGRPLQLTREVWPTEKGRPNWHRYGTDQPVDSVTSSKLNQALSDAINGKGKVAPIVDISSVPAPLLLFSQSATDRHDCDPEKLGQEIVYLTRPVIADGYAFIDDSIGCGPMCGASSLSVYERRGGGWFPIASGFFGEV